MTPKDAIYAYGDAVEHVEQALEDICDANMVVDSSVRFSILVIETEMVKLMEHIKKVRKFYKEGKRS